MKVVLIAVISLDGRLTLPGQPGPGFASPEDQDWFRQVLLEFDCAVMGRATYDTIREEIVSGNRPRLLRMVMTRNPDRHAAEVRPGMLEFSDAEPGEILAALRRRGLQRCAILGGGQIYHAFLDAGLADAMWLTLEPVVLGGGTALAEGGVVHDGRFRLSEMRLLGPDTILLNYQRPGAPRHALPMS